METIPAFLMCCLVTVKAFSIVVNISSSTVQTSQVNIQTSGVSDGIHVDANSTHHGSHSSVTDDSKKNESSGKKDSKPSGDDKPRKTRRAGELSKKKCGAYYPPTPQLQNAHYGGERYPYVTRRRRYAQNGFQYYNGFYGFQYYPYPHYGYYPQYYQSYQCIPQNNVLYMHMGKQTLPREFPHMALIGWVKNTSFVQWICGGSLISHSFVLTAAHCLISNNLRVRLGELDTSTEMDDAKPQDIGIKKLFPHPEFNISTHYHDVGLIELEKQVTLSGYVAIACLDNRKEVDEQDMLTITGWGQTESAGSRNSYLLKGNVYVKPHSVCKESYKKTSKLPIGIRDDIQICAVGPNNEDTCRGDSGGPLQAFKEYYGTTRVYSIVGVTSFGLPCGYSDQDYPGVYTRVYYYLSWIESIVWP